MNATFDINRFLKLEKRNFFLSKMQYLYIIGGLAGLYLLSMLMKILIDISLSGLVYTAMFIIIVASPCFFEKSMSKHGSVFDFILPASTLEKFLGIWLKYVIYIPVAIIVLVFLLNLITSIFPVDAMQVHADQMSLEYIFNRKIISLIISTQAVFLGGYFYFRKYAFAKTSLLLLLAFIALLTIGIILGYYMFSSGESINFSASTNHQESFELGYSAADKTSVSIYTLSGDTIIKILNTIVNIITPLGLWTVCFFKLRETEI